MTRDTVNTTYRHYPIQVGKDRIIVQGPNRQHAEFTTMAAARKFIRDLIALEMTGAAGEEPAAEFTPTPTVPVISSATGALTAPGDEGAISPGSVSASTAEPCVTSHEATPSRQQTDGDQRSGSSNVAALNYLRGMT